MVSFIALAILLTGCSMTVTEQMILSPSTEINQQNLDTLIDQQGFEEIYLTHADGTNIHGLQRRSPNASTTLVVFHGNALNMTLQPWFGILQSLAELNVDVVAIDYQGFGKSDGEASFSNMNRDAELLMASLDEDTAIVLYGLSLGSVMAMEASQDPRVSGVILEGAVSNHDDMIEFFRGRNSLGSFVSLNVDPNIQFDNEAAAARLQVPLLAIHGEDDDNIPYRMSQQIYQSYQGPDAEFMLVEGGGHCNTFHVEPERYQTSLSAFIGKLK